jgi:hypothetical protein
MNYRIYNKPSKFKFFGCQCFKDCDCKERHVEDGFRLMIEVFHDGTSLKKPLSIQRITNGSVRNFVEGMVSKYEKDKSKNK